MNILVLTHCVPMPSRSDILPFYHLIKYLSAYNHHKLTLISFTTNKEDDTYYLEELSNIVQYILYILVKIVQYILKYFIPSRICFMRLTFLTKSKENLFQIY
jgi:hypothetical protein